MKRTNYNSILLQNRLRVQNQMRAMVKQVGGVRATAKIIGVDAGYISRLCNGGKFNPSDAILKRLGLVRVVSYIEEDL